LAWIIFLVVAIPVIGILVWLYVDEAFVRVDPGQLGLVVVRGKATDRALNPGPHFVPVLRRITIVNYPSLELSYRSGLADPSADTEGDLERTGRSLRAVLGDRATMELGYTVRFRLDPKALKMIHERFGPDGIWSAVRDTSGRAVRASLSEPTVGIDDLFAEARRSLEKIVSESVAAALLEDGFELTMFSLGDIDLGRTGEVIQATVRARLELEREQAEAATRLAEVQTDAELSQYLVKFASDAALRYRELDVLRDMVHTPTAQFMPTGTRATLAASTDSRDMPGRASGDAAEPRQARPAADES
jgi:regulator of protease activity HflC (stomatin/prohibitin superfamily)